MTTDYYKAATSKAAPSHYERATSPKPPQKPASMGESMAEMVTGSGRQTRATQDLPSLAQLGVRKFLGDTAGFLPGVASSAALLATYEPEEARDILSQASGKSVGLSYDEAGNAILSLDGRSVLFNRPGFDVTDAAQLAGGAALYTPAGAAGVGRAGLNAIGRVALASGATQAGIEAGQAAAGGQFSPVEVPISAGLGAGGQAIAAGLIRAVPALRNMIRQSGITPEIRETVREAAIRLGFKPEDVTDEVLDSMLTEARQAVTPGEATAIRGEREFNVPLSAGQRTGNQAQLSSEDSMRSGIRGSKAQETMLSFEQRQRMAVDRAADDIQGNMGGPPVTPREAGGNVVAAVRDAEDAMARAVSEAYDQVEDAALSVEGVRGLLRATRNAIRGVEFDRTLKGTKFLLDGARDLDRTIATMGGDRLRPFHIKQVEQWRRRLRTAFETAENAADKRQVRLIQEAFDDHLDRAVADGLLSGDQDSIRQLRTARGLMRDYASLFYPQRAKTKGGTTLSDRAGDLVQRIIYANPTDEEVINAVLGGQSMTSQGGVPMARRFREILGPDSQEWGQVRQAAFRRFIRTGRDNGQDVISADQSLTAFNAALEKNGTLVRELFSQEEIGLIRRYLLQVKRTQPDLVRSRENPSGTAQKAVKSLGDLARRVSAMFGIAGDPALLMTSAGLETVSGIRAGAQAKNATRPFEPIISGRRGTELIPGLFVPTATQARD